MSHRARRGVRVARDLHLLSGDLALLQADGTKLAAATRARVSEATKGIDALGGTFQLGFGGALTSTIAHDASAAALEAALEAR